MTQQSKYDMETLITWRGGSIAFPNWSAALEFGKELDRASHGEVVLTDARGSAGVINTPAKPWKVARIGVVENPEMQARFFIAGENLCFPEGHYDRSFRWYFDDLRLDTRYDLSAAMVEPAAREALEKAQRESRAIPAERLQSYIDSMHRELSQLGYPRVPGCSGQPQWGHIVDNALRARVWCCDSIAWGLERLIAGEPILAFRGALQAAGYWERTNGSGSHISDARDMLRNTLESVIGGPR